MKVLFFLLNSFLATFLLFPIWILLMIGWSALWLPFCILEIPLAPTILFWGIGIIFIMWWILSMVLMQLGKIQAEQGGCR